MIKGEGMRTDTAAWGDSLYSTAEIKELPTIIKAIPYSMWGNRGAGELAVWIRQK